MDVPAIKWHQQPQPTVAELAETYDIAAVRAAQQLLSRIATDEPAITDEVLASLPEGAWTDGLEHRDKAAGLVDPQDGSADRQR